MMGDEEHPELTVDLQTLRIVRAIDEEGSITGAARVLGATQPAISQYLRRAERRLEMSLIIHQGRLIELSEAGHVLSRHAGRVLDALTSAATELSGLANLRSGKTRLVGFPSASATIVPRVLRTLQDRHRGLDVSYTEAEPPEALELVRTGARDVAVVFDHRLASTGHHSETMGDIPQSSLFEDALHLLLPAEHPLSSERFIPLDMLEEDQWIAGCPRCRTHLLSVCEQSGFSPEITYETDNSVAMVGMVSQGLGIALIPRLALGTALLPPGVVVAKTSPSISRTISIVATAEKREIPAVAAVIGMFMRLDGSDWRLRPIGREASA